LIKVERRAKRKNTKKEAQTRPRKIERGFPYEKEISFMARLLPLLGIDLQIKIRAIYQSDPQGFVRGNCFASKDD
jgi:hypothetical protein